MIAVNFERNSEQGAACDVGPDGHVNDNDIPPAVSISFSDLALGMELDEDALLRRFAAALNRRNMPVTEVLHPPEKSG